MAECGINRNASTCRVGLFLAKGACKPRDSPEAADAASDGKVMVPGGVSMDAPPLEPALGNGPDLC